MSVEQIIQLGFAGGIATYLVVFLVRDVKKSQEKILETLEKVVEAIRAKK